MKKRFLSILAVFLMIILAFGMVSCGAKGSVGNDYAADGDLAYPDSNIESGKPNISGSDVSVDQAKIIKVADVTAETQKYAEATEKLKDLIASVGGNISNSNVTENASYRTDGKTEKRAKYTIKVPAAKFDEFLSGLSKIFNITNSTTSTEDVNDTYVTLESRIKTLETKKAALEVMLANVDMKLDFTTWQKISDELYEVESQLNMYYDQLQSLDKKIAYSTINLSVREVVEYTETEEKGYGEQIVDAFKDSFNIFLEFLKGLLLVLIYLLPFILLVGVGILVFAGCVALLIVIIKAIVKRKKVRKNKE